MNTQDKVTQAELSWLPSGNILARCPACVQYDPDATCRECRVFVPRAALAAQEAERAHGIGKDQS
ncbi:MAG: hypothetical protein ACOVPA_20370 [Rubrivivax sp.]